MMPNQNIVSPIAKAGAQLVEKHQIQSIEIIAINKTIVVMDEKRAAQIHMLEVHRKARKAGTATVDIPEADDVFSVTRMEREAKENALYGEVISVDGELHFRPDGYRYLVPVDEVSGAFSSLRPGRHFRIGGQIISRGGQPDRIMINSALPE